MDSQNKLSFVTLDVFTSTRYLGNPLAVVFVPSSLKPTITQETKQRIAREFNLSETVFLHTPDKDDDDRVNSHRRQIDIFTPEQELPFAGHPTIGSAYLVLHHLNLGGGVDSLLTRAGPSNIKTLPSGRVKAQIPHAVHIHSQTLQDILLRESPSARDALLAKLSDDPETRQAELSAPVVSIVKGMTFVLVRLPSLAHLAQVSTNKPVDFTSISGLLGKGDWEKSFISRYYYVVVDEKVTGEGLREWDIQTRMIETTFEDPATGSAACTLSSYLALKTAGGEEETLESRFNITQGVEMGRKSDILVEATVEKEGGEAKVKDLFLGGTAVVVMEGSVLV